MLNYNKILSAINFERVPKTTIANILGIGESTFRSRLDRKNLTPDDVEKIADYFGKPIGYFFDREEKDVAGEPAAAYKNGDVCQLCKQKDKQIEELKSDKEFLKEMLLGKKETHNGNSALHGEDTKRSKTG